MTALRFVDDGEVLYPVDVGGGVRMLRSANPDHRWLVEHVCKVVDGNEIFIAPALDPAHAVVSVDPLTIVPSLLCPDCGLHGHVTDGWWRPC